jgi:hypothetical protein
MRTDTVRPAKPKKPKSSLAARRLIRAALRRHKNNNRAAARALGLPNAAQLQKTLSGAIKDTPSMKVALKRADVRADRARNFVKAESVHTIDPAELRCVLKQLDEAKRLLDALLHGASDNHAHDDSGASKSDLSPP